MCSLITSSAAISRLVFPAATRRRTSSSRSLSPCESIDAASGASGSVPVRFGAAPSSVKISRAACELQRRSVLVVQCPACGPDQEAHAGGFVGRLELLPQLKGTAQPDQCRIGVAPVQRDHCLGVGSHREQGVARLAFGNLLKLAAAGARALPLTDGEHDLDVGRQQRRAL